VLLGLPGCSSSTPACNCRVILKPLIGCFRCSELNLQEHILSAEEFRGIASTKRHYSLWRRKKKEGEERGKANWSLLAFL